MKLIMENFRAWENRGLEEQEEKPQQRTAAIVWNDSSYRPVDKYLEKAPKVLTSWWLDMIPQGHTGVILIKEMNENLMRCTNYQFGANGKCAKLGTPVWQQRAGLWVRGTVRNKTYFVKYNIFDLDPKEMKWLEHVRNLTQMVDKGANQFGYVTNINFNEAANYAHSPKCRDYMVIPSRHGDNCGSYALKVAAAGVGKLKEATKIVNKPGFVGPDQVLEAMYKNKWLETIIVS